MFWRVRFTRDCYTLIFKLRHISKPVGCCFALVKYSFCRTRGSSCISSSVRSFSRVTAIHIFLSKTNLACMCLGYLEEKEQPCFNQKASELQQMTDRVKMLSFQWLKACMSTCSFSYHDWWRHPLLCMRALQELCCFSSVFILVCLLFVFCGSNDLTCTNFDWFSFARLMRDEPLLLF